MPKITFLVGNGFNYLIKDLIKPINEDSSNKIGEITKLWEEFEDLFQEIKTEMNISNDEKAMEIIHAVIKFLSNLENINTSYLKNIYNELNTKITNKIITIAQKFYEHEHSAEYGRIYNYFNFGQGLNSQPFGQHIIEYLNSNSIRVGIYTTNYDGIIETLFSYGTIFVKDGFGNSTNDSYLKFYNNTSNNDNTCFHIHGSYKFKEVNTETIKLKKDVQTNSNPIMIFNKPNSKLNFIQKDNVLSNYFNKFKTDLQTTNLFVIFGNSLNTEPHIFDLINKSYNKNKKIIIVDANPDNVKGNLQANVNISSSNIITKETSSIDSPKDLFDLFKDIFDAINQPVS